MSKEIIEAALEYNRPEFESDCFCKIALKGGYENYIRDSLYAGLLNLGELNLRTEAVFPHLNGGTSNRIDIVKGNLNPLKYFIELGHNGTWQPAFYAVNHAIDDINRSLSADYNINSNERFTVSVLTDIIQLNNNELFRISRSYLNGVQNNIINQTTLTTALAYFDALDPQNIKLVFNCAWNGFNVDIHIVICSIFNNLIDKVSIKNAI
jgi:hypothetical protein